MPQEFKLPEALAWLEEQTARPWTDSEFFEVCTTHEIPIHAAPPLDAQCVVLALDSGSPKGFREVIRLGWQWAILAPLQIAQLRYVGETSPAPDWEDPLERPPEEQRFPIFDPPVRVTRDHLVITRESLERVMKHCRSGETSAAPPANGTGEAGKLKWNSERLAELKSKRKEIGTKRAAEWAGISEARVRELLPQEKSPPQGYSAFNQAKK